MICTTLKWAVKVTHTPTGIEVIRTSKYFRNQHLARKSAMRYLKSRLYMIEPRECDLKIEYISEEDSNVICS